jgi:small subunit ribosomal protein S8
MNIQDPIADMLTRIRNAGQRNHPEVMIPSSKHKREILNVLKHEGYIAEIADESTEKGPHLRVTLKYHNGKHVIAKLNRGSKPSLRRYAGKSKIPTEMSGLGCVIMTTSKGVMTDHQARKLGVGGEIICMIA